MWTRSVDSTYNYNVACFGEGGGGWNLVHHTERKKEAAGVKEWAAD